MVVAIIDGCSTLTRFRGKGTEKNNELTGLTFIGRGFDVRIDIPFNAELNSALTITAEKCTKHCPTGALSRK